jgi:hypothetical protein
MIRRLLTATSLALLLWLMAAMTLALELGGHPIPAPQPPRWESATQLQDGEAPPALERAAAPVAVTPRA